MPYSTCDVASSLVAQEIAALLDVMEPAVIPEITGGTTSGAPANGTSVVHPALTSVPVPPLADAAAVVVPVPSSK